MILFYFFRLSYCIMIRLSGIGLAAVAAGSFFLVSCGESPSRLASDIEGTWSGVPEQFRRQLMIDGQFTPAYQFVRNSDSKTSGVVTQTSQVAVILPFTTNATDSAGNTPVSVTASALATVTGVWSAVDDDDIMLSFDMNTLKIDVDPDAEYLYADPRLSTDIPRVQPIDGNVRSAVTALVKKGMTDVVGNIREIEDVKVKDGMMRCEIGKHNKLTFSKVP